MKLTKVHIALLTNFTEGLVEHEHITLYYSKEVNANTLIARMDLINKMLPVELGDAFYKVPTWFTSWGGDHVSALVTNYLRWVPPLNALFNENTMVHITLGINEPELLKAKQASAPDLNWEHGGTVSQCHAGFKTDGVMNYYTVEELFDLAEQDSIK